jgi:hypothetical protein
MNQIQILMAYFKISFHAISLPMLRHPKWSLSLQAFQLKFCMYFALPPCTLHGLTISSSSFSSPWEYLATKNKIWSSSLCNYLHHSVISFLSGLNILLSSYSKCTQSTFFPSGEMPRFTPMWTTDKITVL